MNRTLHASECRSSLHSGLIAFTASLLLSAGGVALAAPHGGFGGGMARGGMAHGGFAGGGFHGGFARGGFARAGMGRGSFARGYGGHRGGWHDHDWGRRGWRGYGWAPYWGLGLGLGLYLSTLPWDYSTYWWGGEPYYYADSNYYVWDGSAGEYEQVQPPSQVTQQAANAPPPHLYAYPKNGQSAEQQSRDEAACRTWASQQSNQHPDAPDAAPGSDTALGAIAAATGAPRAATGPGPGAGLGSQYARAEAACLQGRGYSVD